MKNIVIIITLLITTSTLSQETINIKDEKSSTVSYDISDDYYFVRYKLSNKKTIQKGEIISEIIEISDNASLIKITGFRGLFHERKNLILNEFQDVIIEPVLVYKDNSKSMCKGEILIKVKDINVINQLFSNYSFETIQNKLVDNQYKIVLEDLETLELIDLVNQLQGKEGVEYIAPNFIRLIKPYTNDPSYDSQWALDNQGYLGGIIDADMDVDEAWNISTGSGIKVAIIDEGVDLDHPDLINNLLPGFDATNGNSNGAPLVSDAHGTACAGIVAAVADNTIGIAGVAYDAKIIPIRYGYHSVNNPAWLITDDDWTANSIIWAYQNGADILSCSWGTQPSTVVTNAINDAINYGRNGKGCVVLFATGNDNTSVAYPANLPNVIAVGASNMFDERKSPDTTYHDECWYPPSCYGGSNFGPEIDIVAPGLKIHTTDISGSDGYNTSVTGDYLTDFNGTSSACPQVSGIAALILAKYPFLSQSEVRQFIERGAEKIPNYIFNNSTSEHPNGTWNNEVGYGRANAMNSLQDAVLHVNATRRIIGQTQLTPGMQAVYTLTLPYTNATHYTWTIPDGCHLNYCWDIITGQNTLSIHISAGNVGVQNITCRAYNGSTILDSKYITVNVQNPYDGGGNDGGDDPCDLGYQNFVIYPPIDPCDTSNYSVNSYNSIPKFKKVYVYNTYGQKVVESNEQEVNISHLSSGIYIIKAFMTNNEILIKKIYKE